MNIKVLTLSAYLLSFSFIFATQRSNDTIIHNHSYIDADLEDKETLSKAVLHQTDESSFHLFSHGKAGQLFLNNQWLSGDDLVAFIQPLLQDKSQLNIYGCQFAQGEKGRAAVEYLEATLGVSVAASDDLTGIDGDWDLEVGNTIDSIEINSYSHNLQTAFNNFDSKQNLSKTPLNTNLRFEENIGQLSDPIRFKANDAQATHFFLDGEIRTAIQGAEKDEAYIYAMEFLGTTDKASYKGSAGGRGRQGMRSYHSEKGSFPDVPMYRHLEYKDLWEGISAVFFERKGQMKYDFKVAPNADPSNIQIRLKGMEDISVNDKGELEFTTSLGRLSKGAPYTFQVIDGEHIKVDAAYVVKEDVLSFELGDYNPDYPLTIDPIALKWASFLEGGYWEPVDSYIDPVSDKLYIVGIEYPTSGSTFSPTSTIGPINTTDSPSNMIIMCMEKDGSAVLWTSIIGGSGDDYGHGIYVDASGDIFIRAQTLSDDFPVNGTVAAYDNTYGGGWTQVVMRLNSTATTIKYSTYFGGDSHNYASGKGIVVDGDVVYTLGMYPPNDFADIPSPTYISSVVPTNTNRRMLGITKINTAVAGTAGIEGFALIGDSVDAWDLKQDGAGNIYATAIVFNPNDAMLTADAVQTLASITAAIPSGAVDALPMVVKFNPSLTELLYASYVAPVFHDNAEITCYAIQTLEVNEVGDIFMLPNYYSDAWDLPSPVTYASNIGTHRNLSNSDYENDWVGYHGQLVKIPASNPSEYEFVNELPLFTWNQEMNDIGLDHKGRIHVFGTVNLRGTSGYSTKANTTAGAVVPDSDFYDGNPEMDANTYAVYSPAGDLLYSTILPNNGDMSPYYGNMFVEKETCTAYIMTGSQDGKSNPMVTPTYRDPETGLQVTVANPNPTGTNSAYIAVFHEPSPENVISDFQAGNNTFCVNSLIYQNPNNGPILGEDPIYTSGDGSNAAHNIPDLQFVLTGANQSHPTPASPNGSFFWQVSRDNGGSWADIPGSTLPVLKPDAETSAGTVQYRRAFVTSCCDTTYSNIATATITGTSSLVINAPTEPVYYCPGTLTDLGVSVSGATGNISWQWYDGFAPITDAEITPASGTNVAQGTFTASIATTQTEAGSYRLIVTDEATGCKKEVFVAFDILTASAGNSSMALCPSFSGDARTIGPAAVNPSLDYLWSGPGGFSSTDATPEVTTTGTYTLQVAVAGTGAYCAAGQTSVEVTASTPHDAALTTIPNSQFCQSDDPAAIGLSGTAPSGYVFQWVPGINIDDAQAYSPNFDPGTLPFDITPIAEVAYTFTALRDDGCIFETTTMVSDTALAIANAGSDRPACDSTVIGKNTTTGLYYQWSAISTTHSSGLATLVADSDFTIDGVNANAGTNYYANVKAPLVNAGADCYEVTYELRSSFTPFPNNCYAKDEVVVTYCCDGADWCAEPTASNQGTNGVCSGETNVVTVNAHEDFDIQWTTFSVDGVAQPAGTAPQGMFTVSGGAQSTAISAAGPHPTEVIANIDDPTWGWSGANFVVYQVRIYGTLDGNTWDCTELLQVFSGQNSAPVIGVLDKSLCNFISGTPINNGPGISPYTVSGVDYTQAPNSAFDWAWSGGTITSGSTSAFPTLAPDGSTDYQVQVTDPVTGCVALDTMTLSLIEITADAGDDITSVCAGSLVQLGTNAKSNHTYSWSPTAGLNDPIGTPNSATAQPYLVVPNAPSGTTYTVTATETTTGCQVTDDIIITTDTDPPATPSTRTWNVCTATQDATFTASLTGDALQGHSYSWAPLAGGGDVSWFNAATDYEPTITVPQGTATGTYTFQLTVTKGTCGSTTQDFTLNVNDIPAIDLGTDVTPNCNTPYTELSTVSDPLWRYQWSPILGLFTDDAGTTPYNGSNGATYHTMYATPSSTDLTYTLTASYGSTTWYGCSITDDITVLAAAPETVDAGNSGTYCPEGNPYTLGIANAGTSHLWEAVGYNADPDGTPATPTAGEASTMLGYLSSTVANTPDFSQSTTAVGVYVYRLTSTFANGCFLSDEVTVSVPVLASGFAGIGQSVCEGEPVQIGAAYNAEYNYFWSAFNPSTEGATINDATIAQPTVSPTVTTSYQVTATHITTGCTVKEIVTVTVTPKPAIADVSMPTQCAPLASSIDLTAQIPSYGSYFNPVWYQNSAPGTVVGTPTAVTPTETTNYFVVLENAEGCADTVQVTANVETPQQPNILPAASTFCPVESIDLADFLPTPSDPSYTLEWHTDNTTNPATLITNTVITAGGTYYLFETTPNFCASASSNLVYSPESCCPAQQCGTYIITINNN